MSWRLGRSVKIKNIASRNIYHGNSGRVASVLPVGMWLQIGNNISPKLSRGRFWTSSRLENKNWIVLSKIWHPFLSDLALINRGHSRWGSKIQINNCFYIFSTDSHGWDPRNLGWNWVSEAHFSSKFILRRYL